MCSLVTVDLFDFMESVKEVPAAIGSSLPSKSDRKKIESVFDTIREDMWLDEVYGPEAKLDNDVWLKTVARKGNWLFNPSELREKILKEAGVTL